MHDDEHPSPFSVFPSSHSSSPPSVLSPHVAEHVSALSMAPPTHSHPHSIWHDALHPSPPTRFPSSHSSDDPAGLVPSPHPPTHVSPGPPHSQYDQAPLHVTPASTMQYRLHPSPDSVFPSSHSSVPLRIPSPHIPTHSPPLQSHPHSTWQPLHPSYAQ